MQPGLYAVRRGLAKTNSHPREHSSRLKPHPHPTLATFSSSSTFRAQRIELAQLVGFFRGQVVDVSPDTLTLQVGNTLDWGGGLYVRLGVLPTISTK